METAVQAIDYRKLRQDISWDVARRELGCTEGGPVNLGYLCSDRNVDLGRGDTLAMIHENHAGELGHFTYRDIQQLSNGWAHYLRGNVNVRPLDRVCLFLDRVPELYIGFLGILKIGAIVEPLFSAFGEDALLARMLDSRATAIITQRRHLGKVRKARERLPDLKTVIVIDHDEDGKKLREGEVEYRMMENREDRFAIAPTFAETPSVLHYTSGTTGAPKGAMHVHGSIFAQYLTTKVVLDLKDDDIYWCTADPGWVTGTSYGIIGPWAHGRDADRARRRVLERSLVRDDREAPRHGVVHGADGDPHAHEGRARSRSGGTITRACGTCAASASR